MPNDFDLQIKWLNGSQIEVQATDAASLSGTEKVLVMNGSTPQETTTQDIADLGGLGYSVYTAYLNFNDNGTITVANELQNTLGQSPTLLARGGIRDFSIEFQNPITSDVNKITGTGMEMLEQQNTMLSTTDSSTTVTIWQFLTALPPPRRRKQNSAYRTLCLPLIKPQSTRLLVVKN